MRRGCRHSHAAHQRPRCAWSKGRGCTWRCWAMAMIVKRMPDSGSQHAPGCPSYEPPAESSGLGQVLGSAITEDPATGETTLKLDFADVEDLGPHRDADSGRGQRQRGQQRHEACQRAAALPVGPGRAGRAGSPGLRADAPGARCASICCRRRRTRSRAVTRCARASTSQRRSRSINVDVINARRVAQWSQAIAVPGKPQHLMLLIAEVKEIVPARYGQGR